MRVYHIFFGYPDPDQRVLMRIRIRANDTDPDSKHYFPVYVFIFELMFFGGASFHYFIFAFLPLGVERSYSEVQNICKGKMI